jgi:DNA polymerase-3 subunit epsilon
VNVSDTTFVVTDVETTGTNAGSDRLLEIGAVKVRGGEITDTFQQLMNPQRSVPSRITQMTGITTAMVFDAPTVDEVMPAYLNFLDDGILAAHNLSFDERFLNAALQRLGRPELENETLCTLRLARRLLPGLKSKGLSRLIQFYGIDVNGRHRGLGDAEATGIILQRFLSQLDFEHDVQAVDDLLAFQHRSYRTLRDAPSHLQKIRENQLPEVPEAPGVYFLKSSRGTILYIGKAKRLDRRVRSYFNGVESHTGRKRKLLQKVRQVDWTVTDTELEALLLESRRIKEEKPSYNRAQRRYRSRPFVRLDTTKDYPTIAWSYHLKNDGAEYYGPLRNREQAELVVDVVDQCFRLRECEDDEFALGQRCLYADMERCDAPCETGDAEAYAEHVDRVRAFLTGQDASVLDTLKDRMEQASANLEFEKAAELRDTLKQLRRILEKQQVAAAPVLDHNAALIDRRNDTVEVLLVRFGRFVASVTGPRPLDGTTQAALRDAIQAHFGSDTARPTELSKRDVDEIRLLSHWMYLRRDDLRHVRWTPALTIDTFHEQILQTIRADSLDPAA